MCCLLCLCDLVSEHDMDREEEGQIGPIAKTKPKKADANLLNCDSKPRKSLFANLVLLLSTNGCVIL